MTQFMIEAEDMHMSGFKTVSGSKASGGKLVKLKNAGSSGDLSTVFHGPSKTYDLTVRAQDESDGHSVIHVKINGHIVGTIDLNKDNNGQGSDHSGFSNFTLEDIEINEGDTISLWAQGDGYEFVRLDKIFLDMKNEDPHARDDHIAVHEDEGANDVDGNVLTNDADPDGDQLVVTGVEGSSGNVGVWVDLEKGRVKINADGTIDFDADGDFDDLNDGESEDVTVMYDVSDGHGGRDWAKVKITVDGKSPPATHDDCIVMEAEDFHLNGFKVVHGDQAMGGELVKLKHAQGSGDLSKTFDGPSGEYNFSIFVQDESDGQSTIKVKINDQEIELIKLDRDSDGRGSNNDGFSEFKLSEPVQINTGDKITLWADGDDHGYEFVRIDKVVLKKEEPPIVDEPCTFRLLNHPDGSVAAPFYGLRLDNVFGDGEYTFDFEADGAEMFATVDNGMIRIFGTALGGRDVGDTRTDVSLFEIDFTYNMVEQAAGDNDLISDAANAGSSSGTITRLDDQGNPVETKTLTDKAGSNPFSFRFGDEDNDLGHRGFEGKSGWGWLKVDGEDPAGAQDWLFTVGEKVVIDANDDCIVVTESEAAGDIEVLEGGATSILENDTGADGLPFAGAVFSVDGVEANVGEFIDLADGGRVRINADGTVDFDADGDFEDLDEGESAMVSVDYTIRTPGTTETVERVIDFEGFQRGTIINTQIDGVTISAQRNGDGQNSPNDAMIFDSSNPTGGDDDLGTPSQGNILIISEDGDSNDPDDNAGGGTIWVQFDDPEHVDKITFIDTEEGGAAITVTFADGSTTVLTGPATVDGGVGTFDIDLSDIVQLDITLQGSGAIDDIILKEEIVTPGAEDTATVKIKILGEDDTGAISGRYFNDQNRDAIENGGDTGVGSATVQLFAQGGALVASTTTNPDGTYSFADVDPGDYFVRFISAGDGFGFVLEADSAAAGADDTNDSDVASVGGAGNGNTALFSLASGEDKTDVDAGIQVLPGSISGRFFRDENLNNLDDGDLAGEFGIGNATIMLLLADGVTPATDENGDMITTVTDTETGEYRFDNLLPGDYVVKFPQPAEGSEFAQPDAGDDTIDSDVTDFDAGTTDPVTVVANQETADVDAGVQVLAGSISGRYFNDQNRDNIENAGDSGFSAAMVLLFAEGGTTPIDTAMTDADGAYSFQGVTAGNYFVRFVSTSSDFAFVLETDSATAGADDTNDSDVVDTATGDGDTAVFALAAGENLSDVDAGAQVGLGSISGRFFRDINGNNLDDGDAAGEFGIGNATIMLLQADGVTPVTDENGDMITAVTDTETGEYRFDDLLPGDYVVKFPEPPANTIFVEPNAGDDTIDSDVTDAVAGTTDPVTVASNSETADVDAGVVNSVLVDGEISITPTQSIVFIIDHSSTTFSDDFSVPGVGDLNGDGTSDTVVDGMVRQIADEARAIADAEITRGVAAEDSQEIHIILSGVGAIVDEQTFTAQQIRDADDAGTLDTLFSTVLAPTGVAFTELDLQSALTEAQGYIVPRFGAEGGVTDDIVILTTSDSATVEEDFIQDENGGFVVIETVVPVGDDPTNPVPPATSSIIDTLTDPNGLDADIDVVLIDLNNPEIDVRTDFLDQADADGVDVVQLVDVNVAGSFGLDMLVSNAPESGEILLFEISIDGVPIDGIGVEDLVDGPGPGLFDFPPTEIGIPVGSVIDVVVGLDANMDGDLELTLLSSDFTLDRVIDAGDDAFSFLLDTAMVTAG
ncbi:MAG: SdrD B-like domain-containing protein [Pseudomonadota bacterium]